MTKPIPDFYFFMEILQLLIGILKEYGINQWAIFIISFLALVIAGLALVFGLIVVFKL